MRAREIVFETPRPAWIVLDDWSGRSYQEIDIIGETDRRYRIWARVRTRLAGRARELKPGESALVPKAAIRWTRPPVARRPVTK